MYMHRLKERLKDFYSDLFAERDLVINIISTLEAYDGKTNFYSAICKCNSYTPKSNLLASRRATYVFRLLQVEHGDLSVRKAIRLFRQSEQELSEAINSFAL